MSYSSEPGKNSNNNNNIKIGLLDTRDIWVEIIMVKAGGKCLTF